MAEHIHVFALSRPEVKNSTRMRFYRKHRDRAVLCILLGLTDIQARLGPSSSPEERARYKEWALQAIASHCAATNQAVQQESLVRGQDLLNLGLKPGPRIGLILGQIQEAVDDGVVRTREQALALADKIVHQGD